MTSSTFSISSCSSESSHWEAPSALNDSRLVEKMHLARGLPFESSHRDETSSSSPGKESMNSPIALNDSTPNSLVLEFKKYFDFMSQKVSPMIETYSGKKQNGLPHGSGKMKYENKRGEVAFEFEGHFWNGKRSGRGTEKFGEGFYRKVLYQNGEVLSGGIARIPFSNAVFKGHLSSKGKFLRK